MVGGGDKRLFRLQDNFQGLFKVFRIPEDFTMNRPFTERRQILATLSLLLGVTTSMPSAVASATFKKVTTMPGAARAFRGQNMQITDSAFAFTQEIPGSQPSGGIQRQPFVWSGNMVQPTATISPTYRLTTFQLAGVYGSSTFLTASYLVSNSTVSNSTVPNSTNSPVQSGLFWSTPNQLLLLLGPGTILPGGDRVKFLIATEVSSKGIAFAAATQRGHQGVYFLSRQGVERIVDDSTLVTGKQFTEFRVNQISVSGKNVAFGGVFGSATGRFGAVYAWRDGKLEQVVDAGSTVAVESRSPEATINGQQVGITAFPGQGKYEAAGVYIQRAAGQPLTTLANNKTQFPDRGPTNPNITSSSNQLCLTSRYSVFFNQDESGRGMFIHDATGLKKLIAVGDRLDGKVVTDLHAAGRYCSSNRLGLAVEFDDEVAIYEVIPDLPNVTPES